jgi:propanediol dehydratase small subunit
MAAQGLGAGRSRDSKNFAGAADVSAAPAAPRLQVIAMLRLGRETMAQHFPSEA